MILRIVAGAVKVLMQYRHIEKGRSAVTVASFVLNIIAVLFLTAARLPYTVTVVFFLLVVGNTGFQGTQRLMQQTVACSMP
jgi:hypothetical protein